ncbi:MAG: hypothetical protein HYZ81_23640 [Nitrospinae bacterium]|nr:hypothetical protein [Nitrospinota bacterium]
MEQPSKLKNVASPVSTGSAGSDYEHRVAAYYLAMALLRSVPLGQEAGIAREVRFQRLYEGEPLDDLIIISDLPTGEAKLALQIKRDLTFGVRDKAFDEVIRACWETFKSPKFALGIDRFGIVVALYSKKIDEHYKSVLAWARNSDNATDFLSRISKERLSHKAQRSFVKLIRTKLDSYLGRSVSDDDLWNFLRWMVILRLDFHQDGSEAYTSIVGLLRYLLPPEQMTESPRLFGQLVAYAAEAERAAGSFDSSTLRQRLITDGFALLPDPNCREDLSRLQEHAIFVLGGIRTDIGGLVLSDH